MSGTVSAKKKIIDEFGIRPGDTGSSEVQVALLTEQIRSLTEHMKTHRKDYASQRSLQLMVSRRQRHLNYLQRTNPESYRKVIKKLGLRK